MEIVPPGSAAELQRLFEHVQTTWQTLGETEPHWSVLTSEEFKQANLADASDRFFSSGEHDVQLLGATLLRCGVEPLSLKTGLEYGCGVGRVTKSLARHLATLHAFDISSAHLRVAREQLDRSGCRNVELHHVRRLDDLARLPQADFVYSVIVLQHNPPPLIAFVLERLLRALRPGGCAYFQVPTYIHGYSFELQRYLASHGTRNDIEMHALPQRDVFAIVRDAGCDVLEVLDDDRWTGLGCHNVSSTFVVQKR